MRRLGSVSLLVLGCSLGARPVVGQSMDQVRAFMEEGGAWLSLDIVDGTGQYTGQVMPTMGMGFQGWFQVADVHRGEWSIRVVDLAAPGARPPVVDVTALPGQRISVAYRPGLTAQMRVDVQWSERADTTLWVWVGLPEREGPGGRD